MVRRLGGVVSQRRAGHDQRRHGNRDGDHRVHLRQDVQAVRVLVDHPLQPADLSRRQIQAKKRRYGQGSSGIGHGKFAPEKNGRSPALARKLRHKLESEIGEEYGELAGLLDEVRREIKQGAARPDGEAWQKALDLDALLALIRRGEKEKARQAVLQSLTILSKGV